MRTWFATYDHSEEQYVAVLEEVPWWIEAVQAVLDRVDEAVGHRICHNRHLHDAFWWVMGLDNFPDTVVHRFPVQEDVALALGASPPERDEDDD